MLADKIQVAKRSFFPIGWTVGIRLYWLCQWWNLSSYQPWTLSSEQTKSVLARLVQSEEIAAHCPYEVSITLYQSNKMDETHNIDEVSNIN